MKTLLHSFGFFILSCLVVQPKLVSQCTPSDFQEVFIHPDSSIVASLIIENAVINDLFDPNQGVCGVSLQFAHQSVKEIEIRLVSPSGQSIDLVGPISPDGSITFNPQWDISFVPCSEVAIPDPGFSNPWTNVDPWSGPQTYTGTYHPYQQCLEDVFNTGGVNGLWSLEILNDARFDDGELISFSLEFCDSNFDCDQCIATPGEFDIPNLAVDYCQGSSELDFDFESVKANNPIGYGYEFYILQGDEIIEIVDDPNLTDRSPGAYQICGLSYYLDQQTDLLNDNSFAVLKDIYNSALSPVCAEFTETCYSFNILPYMDTLMIDTTICVGDSFDFNGTNYNTPGEYSDRIGNGLCDTLVLININTVNLEALISNDSDLLTCDNDRIALGVGSSSLTSNTAVFWRTEGGSIEGNPSDDNIFATQAGRYWLILQEGGCQDSFSIDIALDTDVPVLDIMASDTIDCNVDMVDLIVTSTPAATSYEWTGPQPNLPDDQNIRVSIPGEYSVTVTLPSGCSSIANHTVLSNFIEPDLEITTQNISCNQVIGTAQVLNIGAGITYTSEGDAFNAADILEFTNTGQYTITATFDENGCTTDTTFNIDSDIQEPVLSFEPVENINCGNLSVELVVNADIDIMTYSWEGPDGPIQATQNSIITDVAGEYSVTVVATNGCTNEATQTIIAENTDQPNLSITADIITCNSPNIQIITNADQAGLTYAWTSDNGFTSNLQNPTVDAGGLYYLSARVSDNCEIIDSILVIEDTTPPDVQSSAQSITCTNPSSTLTIENQQASNSYTWLDEMGNELPGLSPVVSEPALYTLSVVGENGCPASQTQLVSIDTLAPVAVASAPEVLLCDRTQVRLSGEGSSVGSEFTFGWSTTDGSIMTNANTIAPVVVSAGTYTLEVTDESNGCTANASVLLEETRTDISDFEFQKFDPPCSSVPQGRIEIGNVTGGEGPYTYSVNGVSFQDEPILDMLSGGVYTIVVKDAFGCDISKSVVIEEGLEVSVGLEDSYEINLGDELLIESMLNTNGDPLRSIEWRISDQSIGVGEDFITVRPLATTPIDVSITTVSGCTSSTSSFITVSKEKDIYVPNIISASDFGENGALRIYPSNAIEAVISFEVFDRWGNKVFSAENYDPHLDKRAWDGSHKSQNLLPGIYVYMIEVLLIDGEQRVIPGEVLLVR